MGMLEKLFALCSGAAREALPEQALLIDVRSAGEFAAGHIGDAISMPLDRLARDIAGAAADKTATVIVYCRSGARSAAARRQMLDMGYVHVINGGGLNTLAARMNRQILR